MDELISKRAVIEAIEKARANVGHNLERSIGKSIIEILDDVGRDVDRLPSAHGTNLAEVGMDCISRKAAIEVVQNRHMMLSKEKVLLINDLEKLPSVQPMRGKWERDGHHIKCDQCGMYMCDTDREGDRIPTEFCPHCGADMREVNNESD